MTVGKTKALTRWTLDILKDKWLISKIYKEFTQLTIKKTLKNFDVKIEKLNKHFLKTYTWPMGTQKDVQHH